MKKCLLWMSGVLALVILGGCCAPKAAPVPLAIWDFDGTIIDGDCSTGLVRDGRKVYDGMIAAWIISGSCAAYTGEDGARHFLELCTQKENTGRKREAYCDETAIFSGADVRSFQAFCRRRFRELEKYYFVESIRKIRELQAAGVEVHVISASADLVVRSAAESLGIPEENIHGIRLAVQDGKTTDQVLEPLPYGEGKVRVMREIEQARGGKALYGFGNSYSTDGPFLLAIAKQGGVSVMINGGKPRPGMTEYFQCITLHETFASRQNEAEKR